MPCSPPICLVGTLVGVGAFADAAIGERARLELMHSSAMHFPAFPDADFVTERTAAHLGHGDVLLLVDRDARLTLQALTRRTAS
ncbi:hypothetical protein OHA02_35440 [Streptomyces phaeochromogenes]|nr:hypothetical protein [Streptomyces phaeochromogenes]